MPFMKTGTDYFDEPINKEQHRIDRTEGQGGQLEKFRGGVSKHPWRFYQKPIARTSQPYKE